MLYCPKCHTALVENAKFCHQCGAAVEIPLIVCSNCHKKNPADARACYYCSAPLYVVEIEPSTEPRLKLSFQKGKTELEEEIKALFFHILEEKVALINPKNYGLYLENFYVKEFNATVGRRSRQLSEEMSAIFRLKGRGVVPALENQLEAELSGLAMYHIVHNCVDVNPVVIPATILKYYDKAAVPKKKLRDVALDFLDFDAERIRFYPDLLSMPAEKLKNASMFFLFAAKDEQIHFICDQSILGNGKEGFALTDFGLYWKSPLNKVQKIYFHQIKKLEKHKDWITINKHFFNVSESLNIKMILLLDRLSELYS